MFANDALVCDIVGFDKDLRMVGSTFVGPGTIRRLASPDIIRTSVILY